MAPEAFKGPWCSDLVAFMKSVNSIPSKYKSVFDTMSKDAIAAICDPDALHIWESDADLDNLLQLTHAIVTLRKEKKEKACMVIIAEQKKERGKERDGYERICEVVRYLTGKEGSKHLGGLVCVFGGIFAVKGVDGSVACDTSDGASAVKRINTAIERVLSKMSGSKKLVWHHGPSLAFLLHWIDNTTRTLRSALTAITVTSCLRFDEGIKFSPLGKHNTPADVSRLESYARKLDIPVVFLDTLSLLISHNYLAQYMYYWGYYIYTILPRDMITPHLHLAMDELVTFAFRVRGACEKTYGKDVVRMVQKKLDPKRARQWARKCVDAQSYTKEACREAGKDIAIHHAVQTANAPFLPFSFVRSFTVPAFARLAVGPASAAPNPPTNPSQTTPQTQTYTPTSTTHIAAPLSLSLTTKSEKQNQYRTTSTAPFHILLPTSNQDISKVAPRIQRTMIAVLDAIRLEKGMPELADQQRRMWRDVVEACTWAIEGCKGKCPEGVEGKVRIVGDMLGKGTFGGSLGAAREGTMQMQGQALVQGQGPQGVNMGVGVGAQWGQQQQQLPQQQAQAQIAAAPNWQQQGMSGQNWGQQAPVPAPVVGGQNWG